MATSGVSELVDRKVLCEPVCSPEAWFEHDLVQRSFLSCSSYLESHDLLAGTQIARIVYGGTTTCSLAVQITKRSASVIGALTTSAQEFLLVASRLLEDYKSIRYVRSELLVRDPQIESDPRVVIIRQADDMNRALPSTIEEFDTSLGKKRLKDIRYHERHFLRYFPDAQVVIKRGPEITPDLFHAVVELHRARMKSKGHKSGVDESHERRMFQVVVKSGFLVLLMDGEDLVAGLVAFMTLKDGYFWMISHDARYDNFGPGITCLYGGFKHLISSGVERMHFLWGDSNYKRQFGTEPTGTASYVVLRPGVHRWRLFPLLYSRYRENTLSWIIRHASENRSLVRVYRKIRMSAVLSRLSLEPKHPAAKEEPRELQQS